MTPGDLEALLDRVHRRVTPAAAEREAMAEVAEWVIQRTEEEAENVPVTVDAMQVGSTARDTWLSGDRDVDIFIRFPPTLSRADLEAYGLEIGREVLPNGREEYAEHPYVSGEIEGFAVDLVPCYRVKDTSEIQSAVDRSPFHTEYLHDRLDDELTREVRLAKRFLDGIGAYGSDLKTEGFSGYLVELLILEYGSLQSFLEAAALWDRPVVLDPAEHAEQRFDGPLVVVDPTDATRNVAAVVNETNVSRLQHFARELLDHPDESIFFPEERAPMSPPGVRAAIHRRDTTPVAVVFDTPDLVDDELYPQLRRSVSGFRRGLENQGFEILRTDTFADEERAVLLVEPLTEHLPAIERHEGPPVDVPNHASDFYKTYEDDSRVYGPFIEGGRYVVERDRDIQRVSEFAANHLDSVSLGSHVSEAITSDYDVLVGDEVASLSPRFGRALAEYFEPTPRG